MNTRRDRSPFNTHADLQHNRRAVAYGELSRLSPREPAIMPNTRSTCEPCERIARLAVIAIAIFLSFFLFYVATA